MDQRIFEQLDMLERGARMDSCPTRDVYNDSSAEFSAYDEAQPDYHGMEPYHQAEDEFMDQPMVLDSFDERLLREPDYNSRHGQAALGQARLSLPSTSAPTGPSGLDCMSYRHAQAPRESLLSRKPDLSRFALHPEDYAASSSSPFNQPLPSSPTFKASQRRPAPTEYARHSRAPVHGRLDETMQGVPSYQPFSVEQLEAEEHDMQAPHPEPFAHPQPMASTAKPKQSSIAPPIVQGIRLVSPHALPDRFRLMFNFPLFNAVQSKCFNTIYNTNDNFVLSAPTGSGKTAVLELAICRLINGFANGSYKVVYQAPTKSLCSERQRDWQAKFGPLDLQCAELTGDTDHAQLRNVQHASIIITTPEKWDSMTRKWKDHQRLMQMVKLFLIDEVHILKEDRGATLEAVVSRMKSVGSDVRFVALSATVPNSEDIATWLGKDPVNPQTPAPRERLGEEFRPVRLQKHVCGYQNTSNDFAFEKTLNGKLPEVITKWSQRKPIMVFCFTRNACVETAKLLANWWATKGPRERYWSSPRKRIVVADKDLKDTVSSGVAFHHAGLSIQDRNAVENAYLEGEVNVICCTSTLAVGVNLPCHMVIIKNTVTYQSNAAAGGCKEYSDLEIMQMLGRAGRPQFDDSAVAIIMTRLQRAPYYEKMITGQEVLESCLHRNLIDHLNAEIGLGTVSSASSAKKWLSGTFLYVRLKDNPEHYKIEGDVPGRSLDERLEHICSKGITLLEENDLVRATPKLQSTEFGDAMARYYVQFETMKTFLVLPPKSKISEILSAISQAAEFKDVRFRAGEKTTYKDLNKNVSIKFPIPVNLDAPAHKVSLIIQSVLGSVELPTEDHKHRLEYNSSKAIIFQHVHRLIRCIVDCQLYLEDAVTSRNALMLARSLGAQVWDDSPLHIKQLEGVGIVAVRRFVNAGMNSIEDLENAESHRLEHAVTRNPPYGIQLQEKARAFPKLRVSVKVVGEPVIKRGEHVTVKVKAEIGFLNEKVPEMFQRKPVYVCLLAETSDGHMVHFARISAKKLNKGQDVLFSANLTSSSQSIRAYVMCDEIAGTMRHANLKPEIPPIAFPQPKKAEQMNQQKADAINAPNTSKRRTTASQVRVRADNESDEFGDADLDDADLARAEAEGFVDIDDFDEAGNGGGQPKHKKQKTSATTQVNENWEPQQLANGKWACNHKCGNKTTCKHLCCREGLDKKPKPPKAKEIKSQPEPAADPKQTQLNMSSTKQKSLTTPAASTKKATAHASRVADESAEARNLARLHSSVKTHTPNVPVLGRGKTAGVSGPSVSRQAPRLSFLDAARGVEEEETSSNYGMEPWSQEDLPDMNDWAHTQPTSRMGPPPDRDGDHTVDEGMLDGFDAGAGISQQSQPLAEGNGDGQVDLSSYADEYNFEQDEAWNEHDVREQNYVDLNAAPLQPNDHDDKADKSNKYLFVGYSSDAAGRVAGDRVDDTQHPETARDSSASKFFAPPAKRQKTQSRRSSAQLREEAERLERVIPTNDFLNDVAEAATAEPEQEEQQSDSPDALRKWFEAEFGTELFNYVG